MNELYTLISASEKYTGTEAERAPRDLGAHVSFGLDLARRNAASAQVEQPAPAQLKPIIPVAN